MTELAKADPLSIATILEQVVINGDLSKLTPAQRMVYYRAKCESAGLNPLSQPFTYIWLQNKLTLYCNATATEQLRQMHGIDVYKLERDTITDDTETYYEVTAYGRKGSREDSDIGVVCLTGAHGQTRADAKMKAVTKAKRRLTLSFVGLGMLDESEVEVPSTAMRLPDLAGADARKATLVATGPAPVQEKAERPERAAAGPPAEILFPSPESDRIGLIQRARIGMARLNKQKVGKLKEVWLGDPDADLEKVDLVALVSFVRDVEEAKL